MRDMTTLPVEDRGNVSRGSNWLEAGCSAQQPSSSEPQKTKDRRVQEMDAIRTDYVFIISRGSGYWCTRRSMAAIREWHQPEIHEWRVSFRAVLSQF